MVAFHRLTDAVVTVCQNNSNQSIEIVATNAAALNLTGYESSQITGKPLSFLLPEKTYKTILELVDFPGENNDLDMVIPKIRDMGLVAKSGEIIPVRTRVVRSLGKEGQVCFDLILQSETQVKQDESVRQSLSESIRGQQSLDNATGLPDRQSLAGSIETMRHFAASRETDACLAVMALDKISDITAQYSPKVIPLLTGHMAQMCIQKLRDNDVVGSLAQDMLGIVLMDIRLRAARIVLNRLRWMVAMRPLMVEGREIQATVTIGYCPLSAGHEGEALLTLAEQYLREVQAHRGNVLIEMAL